MQNIKISLIIIFLFISNLVYSQECNKQLWRHVYHPDRLHVLDSCISVSGTIFHIKKEKDGDLHINVKLDSIYTNLLNSRNISNQHGCLVVEIVCVGKITQIDVGDYCDNYSNKVTIPKKGNHVKITGPYITDTEGNHGWNEIHPVSELTIIN